jgi:thiol-disulfide isomerase/thioredoxin
MKITDIFFERIYNPYKKAILIISLIVIFLTITIVSYRNYPISAPKEKDVANANRREKTANMFFFNADWCPHCKKALPIWQDFVSSYDQTNVNGYIINCIGGSNGIDCSSTDDPEVNETIQKFKVQHYPTIKLVKDQTTIDFDAKINLANLTKFVNTVL